MVPLVHVGADYGITGFRDATTQALTKWELCALLL
jgi:hypothetical protein